MSTEKIMEQAQVFASAWSVVGGPFDGGDAMEVATQEKDELKRMVVEMVDERSALAQRAEDAEQLATARGHTIQGLRYELAEVKVERDTLAPEVQQAGPVRLTEADLEECKRLADAGSPVPHMSWSQRLAFAIESAVLERNGLKPLSNGD